MNYWFSNPNDLMASQHQHHNICEYLAVVNNLLQLHFDLMQTFLFQMVDSMILEQYASLCNWKLIIYIF
jgi:hypothetical protein